MENNIEFNPLAQKESLSDEFGIAKEASKTLGSNGFEAYIIGGAVRDMLMGKEPKDFDLTTNAKPAQVLELFEKSVHPDTSQAYGVTRIDIEDHELEIATYRRDIHPERGRKKTEVKYADNLREDVMRRDFTINALAMNPLTSEIVDYIEGKKDIDTKIIRFIGRPSERIEEDPLRILRAVRFKNRLGFKYDDHTKKALKKAVREDHVESIASERIGGELTLMLANSSRRQALEDLDELGILDKILPELTAGRGVDQGPQFHSEGDVWNHQLLIMEHLGESPSKKLVWAALLHDIGKPITQTLPKDSKDRIRFNEHDFVGARMAKKILKRLKFSSEDIEDICWMIRYHIVISQLSKMRRSKQLKYLSHPSFSQMLKLYEADGLASWHQEEEGKIIKDHKKTNLDEIKKLYQDYLAQPPEKRQPSLKKDLGIDGNWLQKEYKIKEGPNLGKILTQLEENYQDGQIKNKKDAQQFVEDFLKNKN